MIKAVILIGGPQKGTRFRPLSFDTPKHLFPVGGRPMVQHLIEACAKVDGLKEIFLLGYYQVDNSLNSFIRNMMAEYNVNIRYLQEYTTLGTCGGIYHFRDQICRHNPEAFFLINGDVCGDFNLPAMLNFHRSIPKSEEGAMTVMVTEATRQQSLNYGCVVEEKETHKILHFVEKPSTFVSTIINCGVYLCPLNIFNQVAAVIKAKQESNTSETGDERYADDYSDLNISKTNDDLPEILSLEEDILTRLAGTDHLYAFHTNQWWCQVKTSASAIYANRNYLKLYKENQSQFLSAKSQDGPEIIGDVWIDSKADVDPTATIGPNVTIGPGVRVGAGVRIKESIILKDAMIGDHSLILHSIIGYNTVIGCWTRIEGTPSDPNPDKAFAKMENQTLFNKDGKLNPSITVLGSNVQVPSGLLVLNSIVLPHKELGRSYRNEIIL
ncbi:mannose-1-phosphate guanyltransferase alpha-A [Tetranychus urticae]|uniref:Uncharacterized protein n=1 Tax=Tetranychus urticae TaxID=32264 RepID=T1JQ71_TETUR|nr:mannose-1-phosphate guanyltransferase alpha-A [Tetranychus urticae]